MNIISVEHLPPLAVVPKEKALTASVASQRLISQQGRSQQLTVVSKGKAVASIPKDKLLKAPCPPPLVIFQAKKSINQISGRQPPSSSLAFLQRNKSIKPTAGKQSAVKEKPVRPKIIWASKPGNLKKYDNVSAPAPLFGPFKSKIPLASKTPLRTQQDSSIRSQLEITNLSTDETGPKLHESSRNNDFLANDMEGNSIGPGNASQTPESDEYASGIIMETADVGIQTECFCNCYDRGSNGGSGMQQILEEVKKISTELKDLKINITGKTATKLMDGIFPIESEANLIKIQHNMDSTENFELRLKMYLKYLKPKTSTKITTAFKQLISDKFLKGKNWDGSNDYEPINKYSFFETTLFDAWKNSVFTKNVYIAAMREEIGKSHDRERKRNKTGIK